MLRRQAFGGYGVNLHFFAPMLGNQEFAIDAKGGRRGRHDRYKAYTARAKTAFTEWLS